MLEAIQKRFFDIRRGEWPRALALSAFFFLVIAVFWVIKPIKKGALISFYAKDALHLWGLTFGGAEVEQLAKVLNMIVVYGVVVLFTMLVRRFQRQQVIYIFCVLISALLVAFSFAVIRPDAFTAWSLYVFGDIFNSIMVVSFWALANDVNSPGQSKRLYGIIGLGGVVGGFVGATFVSAFVEDAMIGRQVLLLGCIGGMAIIAGLTWFINRRSADTATRDSQQEADEGASGNAALEGARLVFQSKYLLAILGLIGFYEIVSNIIEFQLSTMAELNIEAGTGQDAFFGAIGQWISGVSIAAQVFLTPYLMNRWSVGTALVVLPLADLVLSVSFLIFPILGVAAAMSVADNAFNYSIYQSAKESLYTPTSRDAKYKAKAFIDMFIQRGAKVVAVVLNLGFAAIASLQGVRWLSVASLVVLAAWLWIVRFAGRRFAERSGGEEEEPREEVAA